MHSTRELLLLCIALFSNVGGEVYTAVSELEKLLATESVLLETLHQYIFDQEHRIAVLKRHAERYEIEHSMALRDVSTYLSSPMNNYLLVKRILVDWYLTDHMMQDPYYKIASEIRERLVFPTDEDLFGTATAIVRLQRTYELDTKSVARGKRNEMQFNFELSGSDCFEIGRQSYNGGDYYYAESWLDEALTKNDPTIRWMILEYLMRSAFINGNVKKAADLAIELLSIHPDREHAVTNLRRLDAALKYGTEKARWPEKVQDPPTSTLNAEQRELYHKACRNDGPAPVEIGSRLRCRYSNAGGNPFLLIGPLREEEANLDPRIVLYRDFLRDDEIDAIKHIARPRLQRAAVQSVKTGQWKFADFRISKSTWLENEDDALVTRVSKRIEAMTGLSTESAEEFEIINYGVGGHYEPHYDYFNSREFGESLGVGNRIATVLIYMSDVARGGATVFPHLGVAVRPVKGTAVVWYNLLPDGNGDPRTFHGACPVLHGSKWICNKWLHEVGQELRKPCDREKNTIQGTPLANNVEDL